MFDIFWKLYNVVFLFFKPTDDRGMSFAVFNTMNHFVQEHEIKWENCSGFCIE